jgi:predicted regulator of Ras-like GTPase activity (Roadblock/LC7/MglB family)
MKKTVVVALSALLLSAGSAIAAPLATTPCSLLSIAAEKFDIKIKNDSGDEVTVYNAGSGGSYRLTKNATTTIKMEDGDKLYIYEGGKKGRLLLTASKELDGKVQLFSKL